MEPNTQCTSDGPFFPATALNIVANSLSISSDLLQQPDWAVIFILLACCVLMMVVMILALVRLCIRFFMFRVTEHYLILQVNATCRSVLAPERPNKRIVCLGLKDLA